MFVFFGFVDMRGGFKMMGVLYPTNVPLESELSLKIVSYPTNGISLSRWAVLSQSVPFTI